MKNKEKFASEILDIACSGINFAVNKMSRELVKCCDLDCENCLFNSDGFGCRDAKQKWSESEYREPITADKLYSEYSKMCGTTFCTGCKYEGNPNCHFIWLLDNYNVTERNKDNG